MVCICGSIPGLCFFGLTDATGDQSDTKPSTRRATIERERFTYPSLYDGDTYCLLATAPREGR
jgi:hypothetical protein